MAAVSTTGVGWEVGSVAAATREAIANPQKNEELDRVRPSRMIFAVNIAADSRIAARNLLSQSSSPLFLTLGLGFLPSPLFKVDVEHGPTN
jgi:hypothetical protein